MDLKEKEQLSSGNKNTIILLVAVMSFVITVNIVFLVFYNSSDDRIKSQDEKGVISLAYVDGYKLQVHNVEYRGLTPGKLYKMELKVEDAAEMTLLGEVYYDFTPEVSDGYFELSVYYEPDAFKGKTITFEDIVSNR